MSISRLSFVTAAVSLLAFPPSPAAAWDLIAFGKITTIEMSNTTPGDVRVYLDNALLAPCVNGMALVTTGTANFDGMVAGLDDSARYQPAG